LRSCHCALKWVVSYRIVSRGHDQCILCAIACVIKFATIKISLVASDVDIRSVQNSRLSSVVLVGFALPRRWMRIDHIPIRQTWCRANDNAPNQAQNYDGSHWRSPKQTDYRKNTCAADKFQINRTSISNADHLAEFFRFYTDCCEDKTK
jgi:hypothetical protein